MHGSNHATRARVKPEVQPGELRLFIAFLWWMIRVVVVAVVVTIAVQLFLCDPVAVAVGLAVVALAVWRMVVHYGAHRRP